MSGSYFYRKIILVSLFVAFCVGGLVPKNADALGPTPEQGAAIGAETTPQKTSTISTGSSDLANSELGGSVRSEPGSEKNEDIYCFRGSWDSGLETSIPGCIALGLQTVLGWVAWVLWLSAVLFNFAIPYTLNMADFIRDIPIVALGWATFRDVANLFFIFIILYIAISEILGRGDYGIKKLLGKVIIGAMFINFSLFFTQALVDVSNIFTLQFYNKITQTDSAKAAVSGGATGSKYDGGISASFVKALGLEEIWNVGKSATKQSNSGATALDPNNDSGKKFGLNSKNIIIASLGGIILVLITAFIFFAAIIMFLARAVTLIFLMILSPIAFLGHVLPELGKHTGKWWKHLIDNLLFAPAYMALLYLVISIIADKSKFNGVGGGGSFVGIFAGEADMIGSIMTFFVLIMMMVGCLFVAKEFSVVGSGWAFKKGQGWAEKAGASLKWATLGAAGGLGRAGFNAGMNAGSGMLRNTAGYFGDKVSGSKFLARIASKPFGGAAAALMQKADKLRDAKIGGKSFNDEVKESQKDYTKRGNLIEQALMSGAPKGKTPADLAKKQAMRAAAGAAEKAYLSRKRFMTYAGRKAKGKSLKASEGTNNKEALEDLLNDKFSQQNHNTAKQKIENLNSRIQTLRSIVDSSTNKDEVDMNNAKLNALVTERAEHQAVVDGHLRTVEKLSNLESK